MNAILIDTARLLALGTELLSGRISAARAFAFFAAAAILTGRVSVDDAFERLTTPAILAVTSLVIIASALSDIRVRTGDVLILSAGPDFGSRGDVRPTLHILEVDTPGQTPMAPRIAWALGLSFLAFLGMALTQAIPFHHAALALAAVVVGLTWASAQEVRRSFPLDLVIILCGAVLMSPLITQSGLAAAAASFIATVTSNLPPEAFPLATAFGASASFFMSSGYQFHLMVMTPGRYRLSGFLSLGSLVFIAYATAALGILTLYYL